ncbi:MAG: sugar transferase [gamma proteobacterium symbiont of Taylorina sp.]|nr:sugar transferase [gamma proteobacterium symbiont of Taylorina sp.]
MNYKINNQLFNITRRNKVISIIMSVRFTAKEACEFPDLIQLLCPDYNSPVKIILYFNKTIFIDSSGIGALVKCFKYSKENNIQFMLCEVNQQIHSVLTMTGLEQLVAKNNTKNATPAIIDESIQQQKLSQKTHPSLFSKTKRLTDIIGSIVGLLITSTVIIPIALAIKLDTPGPLFFSQKRIGWLSRRFELYKFRTMVIDAEAHKHEVQNEADGAIFKSANDPRITRVGKFLRRTSLDELPQFWNVLEGSMSLVGTRPPTQDELDQYHVPHWQRLDVKPGITGEWQVNGRSGIKNFEDIIRMDLDYQRKWSLLYDIKLLLKTIKVVFSKSNGAM